MNSLQIEQNNKAFECIFKISVCSIGTSTEAQYSWLLAPDAAKFVCEQLEKCTKVKMVDGKAVTAETPLHECSCKFHQTMEIIIQTYLCFYESSHQLLFEEMVAHNRWRLGNHKSSHKVFNGAAKSSSGNIVRSFSCVNQ